ncbi:MAG: hypothetical protein KA603_11890 [Azonexus sp.]|nr:hypothetical protein [Betaproteobacteria bacterium]MBK8917562.1 hypothetical protein [Betaproteobacteria bacterium]MBP6036827.1 hypothetical protein [Azonexus sp.]MBP6907362.1 hypothetical protein [Azonexus sp.]
MKPQLLTLALDTSLEDLLGLPQAIRIVTSVKDELSAYSPDQLHDVLRCVNGMIEAAVQESKDGNEDESCERNDQRDLDWLIEAINHDHLLVPASLPDITDRDYLRVLSIHKVGYAIDTSRISLTEEAVSALMEALEAMMLVDLLPGHTGSKNQIDEAWHAGLRPNAEDTEDGQVALSRVAQKAANIRHGKNRQAKTKAIELYFGSEYSSIEVAAEIISEQVYRAPSTIRRWIFEARKARGLTGE